MTVSRQKAKTRAGNQYEIEGDVAYVYIEYGVRFMIDKEDLPLIDLYKWHLSDGYVVAYKSGRIVRLHRLILKARPDELVGHVHGGRRGKLDNRKESLTVTLEGDLDDE